MQGVRPLAHHALPKRCAYPFIAGRSRGQSLYKIPYVESSAAHHNRNAPSPVNLPTALVGAFDKIGNGIRLVKIEQVDEVMRQLRPFCLCWFCRTDVEAFVDLHGIRADHFRLSAQKRKTAFAE